MGKEKAKKILENFLHELETLNKSKHTIINYRSDLTHFLENCSDNIDDLTVESLRQHLSGLDSKSPTTKSRHISSLKTFLNWCYKKDYIQNNPIHKIDKEKPKVCPAKSRSVNKNSIEKVICSINIFNQDNFIKVNNLKYRALFTLMLEGGLKISEALNLKLEDIETDTETILINSENKRRIPLYSSESIKLLRLYADELNIQYGLIFRGGENEDKSLTYQAVNRFWRKYCLKNGVNIKLQQLRDYYAYDLVKKGFNIGVISKLLGHRSIQTTIKYL